MIRLALASACGLMAMAGPALASGGGGGGGGGFGAGPSFQPQPEDEYTKGSRVFRKVVTCKSCDYAEAFKEKYKEKLKASALEVANKAAAGELFPDLSPEDRQNLIIYMARRYKLV